MRGIKVIVTLINADRLSVYVVPFSQSFKWSRRARITFGISVRETGVKSQLYWEIIKLTGFNWLYCLKMKLYGFICRKYWSCLPRTNMSILKTIKFFYKTMNVRTICFRWHQVEIYAQNHKRTGKIFLIKNRLFKKSNQKTYVYYYF